MKRRLLALEHWLVWRFTVDRRWLFSRGEWSVSPRVQAAAHYFELGLSATWYASSSLSVDVGIGWLRLGVTVCRTW